jgi:hypothetical protein
VTASVTHGRALRYAKGSARGLLHHHPGHCPAIIINNLRLPYKQAHGTLATSGSSEGKQDEARDEQQVQYGER